MFNVPEQNEPSNVTLDGNALPQCDKHCVWVVMWVTVEIRQISLKLLVTGYIWLIFL